ncbi:MAG: cob(I)yrinic acid a,c-diamide adenosyltransferase [Candidatus Aenigmatarchaeota archaeon]
MGIQEIRSKLGMIHVYTGDGKGKTSMALGVALRAAGHNLNVYIIQFLKGGGYCGEYLIMDKLPSVYVKQFGQKCPWSKKKIEGNFDCGSCRFCFSVYNDDKKRCQEALEHATKILKDGRYDVVVLDEINVALSKKMIKTADVLAALKNKAKNVEVILAGRKAPKALLNVADYVTLVRSKKHPFYKGKNGRVGIEC